MGGACRFLLPLSVCLGVAASSTSFARADALRLEDAVRLALSRNERAQVANLQIAVAEAGVSRARAGFLPVVTLGATELLRPYTVKRDDVTVVPWNSGASTFTIAQPILNLPACPLYGQAKRLLEAQTLQSSEDKRQLAFDAARAFLAVLVQESVLKAASRRLESAKATLADVTARVQAGLNSSNDITRAEILMATSEREVAIDEGIVQKAMVTLSFVTNAKVDGALVPPEATLASAEHKVGAPESLVAVAEAHRLNVAASKERVEAAKLFAEEPGLRFAPVLGAAAQLRGTTDSSASGRWLDETLTLTLTWTIYDAGIRGADAKAREAQASIAQLDLQTQRRVVDADVRAAVVSLQSAQAAFDVADDVVAAAKKSVAETGELYRQGIAHAIELVDAEAQLFEAEVSFAGAQYTMVQAYLDLRAALGLDPLGTELS